MIYDKKELSQLADQRLLSRYNKQNDNNNQNKSPSYLADKRLEQRRKPNSNGPNVIKEINKHFSNINSLIDF